MSLVESDKNTDGPKTMVGDKPGRQDEQNGFRDEFVISTVRFTGRGRGEEDDEGKPEHSGTKEKLLSWPRSVTIPSLFFFFPPFKCKLTAARGTRVSRTRNLWPRILLSLSLLSSPLLSSSLPSFVSVRFFDG